MSKLVRSVRGLPGLLGVAVPAAVAAHCVGYELAVRFGAMAGPVGGGVGHSGLTGHGVHGGETASIHATHIPLIPLTSGALLVGAMAVLAAVVTARRVVNVPRIAVGTLIAAQFVVMGMIELAGWMAHGSLAVGPVLVALVVQVPVAIVVFQLCRQVRHVVVRLIQSASVRRLTSLPPVVRVPLLQVRFEPLVWSLSCPGRGPPTVVMS